jgi:hypothetical protein
MTDILDDEPREGHNQPPPSDALERAADLVANANRWRQERPEIANEEQAGAAQTFVDQLRKVRDDLDADQKTEIEPFDAIIFAIKLRYKDPRALVQLALVGMLQLTTAWLDKVKARKNREADDRRRAADEAIERANKAITAAVTDRTVEADLAAKRATEEAERLRKAAAKPVERPHVKGDYSNRAMGLRQFWHAEITNETDALRSYAKHPKIREAALIAVKRQANLDARTEKDASKAPKGVAFIATEKAI